MSQEQLYKLGELVELSITGRIKAANLKDEEPSYEVEFRNQAGIYIGMAIVPQSAIVVSEAQALK